ncbi:Blp family class II bacteriocin [Priestia filamentosa]|uniref:Blp family class II bacteriocin n=1 Tax=Priestia filamentosa TaxID=1402861 RepID=UPI003F14DB3E
MKNTNLEDLKLESLTEEEIVEVSGGGCTRWTQVAANAAGGAIIGSIGGPLSALGGAVVGGLRCL